MANHKVVNVDPKDVQNAEKMWHNFTVFGKYTILAICALMAALAAAFVQF